MQRPPRYSLIRRILFPYSGEEPLSRKQGLRVIGIWTSFFAFALLLCTLPISLSYVGAASGTRAVLLLLIAFSSGVVSFCALAGFAIFINNRAARIAQQRKAARASATSGGRYGS